MRKYSDQKRVAAARDYCAGTAGYREVAHLHGVNVSSLRIWAAAYKVHGAVGVKSRRRRLYTAQFKLSVLQRIRNDNLSLRRASALFNIRNRDMILLWQRAYDMGGAAALHPHQGIRSFAMNEQTDVKAREDTDDSKRSRQELLDELQQLRMENAYLKKLKALAQAEGPAHDKGLKSCRS
jgi:transposase